MYTGSVIIAASMGFGAAMSMVLLRSKNYPCGTLCLWHTPQTGRKHASPATCTGLPGSENIPLFKLVLIGAYFLISRNNIQQLAAHLRFWRLEEWTRERQHRIYALSACTCMWRIGAASGDVRPRAWQNFIYIKHHLQRLMIRTSIKAERTV